MFPLSERISAFEKLGRFMGQLNEKSQDPELQKLNQFFHEGFQDVIQEAGLYNNWFTKDNVNYALRQWSASLTEEQLNQWVDRYPADHFENDASKTVAVVMAGNIPLVGFHDFVSVLMSGHRLLAKPSSDDSKLLPFLAQVLVAIDRRFAERIKLADGQIKKFDAVIATGSNNSARYFDYYFGKYPHIIRKNRTSIGVVSGLENEEQLKRLGEDVFRYFGLGCRNVSKIYVPRGYDPDKLFGAFFDFQGVIENKKYSNNYDYHRAVLMMEKEQFLENGFMIIKPSEKLQAPVSVVYTEEYDKPGDLNQLIDRERQQIQCVVAEMPEIDDAISFGSSQQPRLWDYADNVDTIRFLRSV